MPEMLGPGAGHIRAVEQKSIFKRENPIRGIQLGHIRMSGEALIGRGIAEMVEERSGNESLNQVQIKQMPF